MSLREYPREEGGGVVCLSRMAVDHASLGRRKGRKRSGGDIVWMTSELSVLRLGMTIG